MQIHVSQAWNRCLAAAHVSLRGRCVTIFSRAPRQDTHPWVSMEAQHRMCGGKRNLHVMRPGFGQQNAMIVCVILLLFS
jgi:hypothetical protein